MLAPIRTLVLSTLVLAVLGCGGGGDDDEDDDGGGASDESAEGVWQGTYQLAGGQSRPFSLFAAPSGQFAGIIAPTIGLNDSRIVVGTGDVLGSQMTASAVVYATPGFTLPNGAAFAPTTAFSGTVSERASITGSATAGGETGSFNLTFSARTNRGSSLSTAQGVYAAANNVATLVVTSGGLLTFNSTSGCIGNGAVATIDPALNLYSWSMTISGCAAAGAPSGLAIIDDFNGVQNNFIVLIGAQPDRGFYFAGSK